MGRISISTKDDEDRIQALLTMRVLLLSVGTGEQTFSTTVPYKVFEQTPALLVLHQEDVDWDGYVYLYSQEILLNP